jgi:ABC-type polysaccharide transport system permease subunit
MSKQTRSDKKFPIKLWISSSKKKFFRSSCMQHHLSMMFVGEQFIVRALQQFSDDKLHEIIKERLDRFKHLSDTDEVLGIRVVNSWWQKIGFFAIHYETSVAKITSCIFDYAYEAYELKTVYKEFGTYIPRKRKKGVERKDWEGRLSDY